MTGDIKVFYLGTPMKTYKYARLNKENMPQEFIDLHNLEDNFEEEVHVYMEIMKGMYGLKQAGKLANNQLNFF